MRLVVLGACLLGAVPAAAQEAALHDQDFRLQLFTESVGLLWEMETPPERKGPERPEAALDLREKRGYVFIGSGQNALELGFDLRRRSGRIRLGAGDPRAFALHLASDVSLDLGKPRLRTRLDVAFLGRHLRLDLPDVKLNPKILQGELHLELTMPLLEGRF